MARILRSSGKDPRSRLGFSITEPVIWLLAFLKKFVGSICSRVTTRSKYAFSSKTPMPEEVYHVTVMPCYDKKLEAAREDFVFQVEHLDETQKNTVLETTEVDSVLTSGEVLELIQSTSIDFGALEESAPDKLLTNVDEEGNLFGVSGSSGGYADTIFRHTAKVLYGREIKGPLEFKTKRNTDFREVSLEELKRSGRAKPTGSQEHRRRAILDQHLVLPFQKRRVRHDDPISKSRARQEKLTNKTRTLNIIKHFTDPIQLHQHLLNITALLQLQFDLTEPQQISFVASELVGVQGPLEKTPRAYL
ncbi:hypothetical protein RJ639_021404 [Escallonia herrerae]|uniref:Iron hydrogenase large subunit C-terminal domain-containing protein n=1 Tax=Escallonia herrerae TaxID=1293975 RepID=A0AA88V5Z6_9ASTE|nr:hypothetical protein RJ639_021404 [Escallonia herrerae]